MLCKAELSLHKNDKSRCYQVKPKQTKNNKTNKLEASLKVIFQSVFLQGQQNHSYKCIVKEKEYWSLTWVTVTLTSEIASLN